MRTLLKLGIIAGSIGSAVALINHREAIAKMLPKVKVEVIRGKHAASLNGDNGDGNAPVR